MTIPRLEKLSYIAVLIQSSIGNMNQYASIAVPFVVLSVNIRAIRKAINELWTLDNKNPIKPDFATQY